MAYTDIWWTAPAESESGRIIMVTGRDRIDEMVDRDKYPYRVEVVWKYESDKKGMPQDEDASLMEEATEALREAFKRDKIAVLTGIYTGDGERDWVFYVKNLPIFNTVFNKALDSLPTMPLVIDVYSDPEWEEYEQMKKDTYLPDED